MTIWVVMQVCVVRYIFIRYVISLSYLYVLFVNIYVQLFLRILFSLNETFIWIIFSYNRKVYILEVTLKVLDRCIKDTSISMECFYNACLRRDIISVWFTTSANFIGLYCSTQGFRNFSVIMYQINNLEKFNNNY